MEQVGKYCYKAFVCVYVVHRGNKAHIQLYGTQGELENAVEVRVSNTEVVEVEAEALSYKSLHISRRSAEIFADNALGKLKADAALVNVTAARSLNQSIYKAVVGKICHRKVNGDAHIVKPLIFGNGATNLVYYKPGDVGDKACLFSNGNKLTGADKSAVGLTQTNQRLHRGEGLLFHAPDRLEPNLKAMIAVDGLQSADNVLFSAHFLAKLGSIFEEVMLHLLHLVQCVGKLLVEGSYIHRLGASAMHNVASGLDLKVRVAYLLVCQLEYLFCVLVVMVSGGQHQTKGGRVNMEGNALVKQLFQCKCKEVKHLVSCLVSVYAVKHVVVFHTNEVNVELVSQLKAIFYLGEETALVIKACESVYAYTVALEVEEEDHQQQCHCERQEGTAREYYTQHDANYCADHRLPRRKARALADCFCIFQHVEHYYENMQGDEEVSDVFGRAGDIVAGLVNSVYPTCEYVRYQQGEVYDKLGDENSSGLEMVMLVVGMFNNLEYNVQGGYCGCRQHQKALYKGKHVHTRLIKQMVFVCLTERYCTHTVDCCHQQRNRKMLARQSEMISVLEEDYCHS